jgi:hypothetical protein
MIKYEVINSKLSEVKLLDVNFVIQTIEEIIANFHLDVTQKTTLSTMKGSYHYHLKHGKKSGVLEVTYWPQKKSLFIEIHENRISDWNKNLILPFSESLAECFSGVVQSSN